MAKKSNKKPKKKTRSTKVNNDQVVKSLVDQAVKKSIARAKTVPLSEDQRKFHEDWDEDDCIAELRRIALIDTDKVIKRNYFRVHSDISESTWNRHFGTFEEFKRAAGLKLTRQQHKLERHIALQASVDHYRKMNIDKADYIKKYTRNRKSRFKTILVGSDLHDIECDRFWLRVFLDTAKRIDPDVICLNGDVFDLPEFGKYHTDPRIWDVRGRIVYAHEEILRPLRDAAPNAQIDLIEGNHEARLLRHLCDQSQAMKVLLNDLHGMGISDLLALDRFEINYISHGDLAATAKRDQDRELAKNYKVYYDAVLAHHFPHGRFEGMPGWCGHHHKYKVWEMYNKTFGAYNFHQLGGGHKKDAPYCDGSKWQNGFMIVQVDTVTKKSNLKYIDIGDFTCVEGKWYHRTKDEVI